MSDGVLDCLSRVAHVQHQLWIQQISNHVLSSIKLPSFPLNWFIILNLFRVSQQKSIKVSYILIYNSMVSSARQLVNWFRFSSFCISNLSTEDTWYVHVFKMNPTQRLQFPFFFSDKTCKVKNLMLQHDNILHKSIFPNLTQLYQIELKTED